MRSELPLEKIRCLIAMLPCVPAALKAPRDNIASHDAERCLQHEAGTRSEVSH